MNKSDRRKMNSRKTRAKKVLAGKKGRGKNAFDDMRSIRKDPDLQKRIDLVVEMAKAHEVDHAVDVMYDSRHTIRHATLKVIRVG